MTVERSSRNEAQTASVTSSRASATYPKNLGLSEGLRLTDDVRRITRMDSLASDRLSRPACILDFWKSLELFSPQRIPRMNPKSGKEPVFRTNGEMPLPWETPGWMAAADEGLKWRFTAYCGIYKLGRVRSRLERHFGRDPRSFDGRPGGESCLFALQITSEGRPLLDTFVLASCGWAVGRLENPGPADSRWLNGFESAAQEEALRFAERFAIRENDEIGRQLREKGIPVGRPTQPGELEAEVMRIAQSLGVRKVLRPEGVRLAARQVGTKFEHLADGTDFLNSFFLHDLERIADEARDGNLGPALTRFLAGDESVDEAARQDTRGAQAQGLWWSNLAPHRVPSGRWPAPSDQSLYFSQQFALNSALRCFAEEQAPLFSVNGPPGTGKTTLLRELIASVVVERAKVLASLNAPGMAFSRQHSQWTCGDFRRTISNWREDLLGFEIVVASSNNRAVENVSLEIPTAGAVDERLCEKSDYFADFATRLLYEKKGSTLSAWGLVAARLGNKRNRRKFINRFWLVDQEELEPVTRAGRGFLRYLKGVRAPHKAWDRAVNGFKIALAQEAVIREDRVAAWEAAEAVDAAVSRLQTTESEFGEGSQRLRHAECECEQAAQNRERSRSGLQIAIQARHDHLVFKPGMVDAVFSRGQAYRDWREKDLRFAASVSACEEQCTQADLAFETRIAAKQELGGKASQLCAGVENRRAELADQVAVFQAAREKLGSTFADPEDWLRSIERRELSSPWADENWNRARTRVFLEALHLHRTFIECEPIRIKNNLLGAIDLLTGKGPTTNAQALRSAWATLFFVIPVVSTTFASFNRLFASLGRESLGWLLIDEAGQAVPQAAAGAIWRSRRTLVVGDPLQLEPIVPLPFTAQQALRKHFGVEETWLPSRNSVQTLADRVNTLGTRLQSDDTDQPVWVGSPLRVHSRCENPMFSISNAIAYDGQMVSATLEAPNPAKPSCWLDTNGGEADDHWIPEQGVILKLLLADLFRCGIAPSAILLLSPFRAVARELREIATRYGISQSGTIHVSQGREADIVILVLGGNPRLPGAKEWASQKPNLLNVAVSRARRRLYVIGDREDWSRYPHFADAAALLSQQETKLKVMPAAR